MLPPDYLNRLRQVEVRARLVSEQLMGGRLSSVFKGRGMDFADVREYVPGDDVRRIDWNVTARLRKPFIKRHIEERELVVMLLVDVSESGHFGTVAPGSAQAATKRELAALLAGALAFSAVREGDRVGLISFTESVERFVPPRKTRAHVTRLLHELLFARPKAGGTSLTRALHYLNNLLHRPALVFVISDFQDADEESWTRALKTTNQRHEVVALRLVDPRELELPDVGLALVEDSETGEIREWNTSDPQLRAEYARASQVRADTFREVCRTGGIPEINLRLDESWAQKVQRFLDTAARRRVA